MSILMPSGKRVNPLDPDLTDIDIEDIAIAISNQCRFGGRLKNTFYSVAQHSRLVSQIVPQKYKFSALMHDATEAFVQDLSRSIKELPELEGYRQIEALFEKALAEKYGLLPDTEGFIRAADNSLLVTEMRQFFPNNAYEDLVAKGYRLLDLRIIPELPKVAEDLFLRDFKKLYKK